MATEIWVNIGSGNGLWPDSTKPLPEQMLTYYQSDPMTTTDGNFMKYIPAINDTNVLRSTYVK